MLFAFPWVGPKEHEHFFKISYLSSIGSCNSSLFDVLYMWKIDCRVIRMNITTALGFRQRIHCYLKCTAKQNEHTIYFHKWSWASERAIYLEGWMNSRDPLLWPGTISCHRIEICNDNDSIYEWNLWIAAPSFQTNMLKYWNEVNVFIVAFKRCHFM